MFRATALVYSSHNRSEYLHRYWLVERALQSIDNKTIFYVPISYGRHDQQDFGWGTFRWYFQQYEKWGLEPRSFYWTEDMAEGDYAQFFDWLANSEVVILGGGSSILGLKRYRDMAGDYFGNRFMFDQILHDRQNRGLLTAGFSAGSDQLGEYLAESVYQHLQEPNAFGLAKNVMTTLHHEWGKEDQLIDTAQVYPHCMVFGLPNDSGIALDQGHLPSGNIWQVMEFVIDNSWDLPNDAFHIKTRAGLDIEHYYNDGRKWTFHGGDRMVRIISPDGHSQQAFIQPVNNPVFYDYWSQQPTGYQSIEQVLATH